MTRPAISRPADIALLTYGTRGDVEPFLALAIALRRAGYQVRLAAPAIHAPLAQAHAIPFEPLPGDLPALAHDMVTRAGTNWLRTVVTVSRFIAPLAAQAYRTMMTWASGADLIVHSFLTARAGHELAEQRGIPSISVQLFPAFAPTAAFAAPVFPELPLGGTYRRLTHECVMQIFRRGGDLLYHRVRAADPTLPALHAWPYGGGTVPRPPILCAFSRYVIPPPPEWAGIATVTGYWPVGTPPQWAPPADLRRFLDQGDPPVYVGLGSGGSARRGAWIEAARAALQHIGLRGLLDVGPDDPRAADLPASILPVSGIPHAWLFPRVAAVVHHGGAGTTGAGLTAGKPTVVIPVASDQPFWGRRVHALGVGPRPIPVRSLTARRLSEALAAVMTDGGLQANAARLGERIRTEDGVGEAIRTVARLLGREPGLSVDGAGERRFGE